MHTEAYEVLHKKKVIGREKRKKIVERIRGQIVCLGCFAFVKT